MKSILLIVAMLVAMLLFARANAQASTDCGNITLDWTAPTKDTDGNAVKNLTGFKYYYGTNPAKLDKQKQVGLVSTDTVTGLACGTWYFAMTALTSLPFPDDESARTNLASKQLGTSTTPPPDPVPTPTPTPSPVPTGTLLVYGCKNPIAANSSWYDCGSTNGQSNLVMIASPSASDLICTTPDNPPGQYVPGMGRPGNFVRFDQIKSSASVCVCSKSSSMCIANGLIEGYVLKSSLSAPAPAPTPVDCVLSAWSNWSATSEWSACDKGSQSRSEQRVRSIVTSPSGGAACGALTETRIATQTCDATPPAPIQKELCLVDGISGGTRPGYEFVNGKRNKLTDVAVGPASQPVGTVNPFASVECSCSDFVVFAGNPFARYIGVLAQGKPVYGGGCQSHGLR